jgi:hypothetical protein
VSDELHGRQILLIGPAAQRAIERASVQVEGVELEREVAERYARRAGFGSVTEAPHTASPPMHGDEEGSLASAQATDAAAVIAASRSVLRQISAVMAHGEEAE